MSVRIFHFLPDRECPEQYVSVRFRSFQTTGMEVFRIRGSPIRRTLYGSRRTVHAAVTGDIRFRKKGKPKRTERKES